MKKPYPKNRKSRPALERFEEKFIRNGPDECWPWTAGKDTNGYGNFYLEGRLIHATRASYAFYIGPVPAEKDVCHSCDNPICVNPRHLWLGSVSQNMLDCRDKGRLRRNPNLGTRNHMSKLNEEAVKHILQGEMKQTEYARLYGVSQAAVWYVINKRNWKHLSPSPSYQAQLQ